MSLIANLVNEVVSFCSFQTKDFLNPNTRDEIWGRQQNTKNDIWIMNYCMSFISDLFLYEREYEYIYSHFGDDFSRGTFREIVYKRFLYLISMENSYPFKYYMREDQYDRCLDNAHEKESQNGVYLWNGYYIKTTVKNIAALDIAQYQYSEEVGARKNDVILDCGASQGEEVFFFLQAGAKEVFSFSLGAKECENYIENMRSNSITNAHLYRLALSDSSHKTASFFDDGSRSKVSENGDCRLPTISLDDFVNSNKISGPFFIKMDIEGSEKHALAGARSILSDPLTHGAISVNHWPTDIREVGVILLNTHHRLFLRQCKSNISETMMYF